MSTENVGNIRRADVIQRLLKGDTILAIADDYGLSDVTLYHNTNGPEFAAALAKATSRAILDGAPAAVRLLRRYVEDETIAPRVRLEAARTLLDRAGFAARVAEPGQSPGDAKALQDMSRDELLATLDKAESELANRAVAVDSAPDSAPVDAKAADLLD